MPPACIDREAMINKRLLIKNLLSHNDESSFYDKKRQLNLHTKEGKAKFIKHICALSNSNPSNNSYIVLGVEDESNEIVGDDFFDDSRIQNLVNAYLVNPPKIQYDNIPFPHLPKDKVVGLVTIRPNSKVASFKKNIYTIPAQTTFVRIGSNSVPTTQKIGHSKANVETVISLENNARNNIEHTLAAVLDFYTVRHADMTSHHQVFKEQFVICWAGIPKLIRGETYLRRVDVEFVSEQVKLFYSNQDWVSIRWNDDSFTLIEYVPLGLNDKTSLYPLEEVTLRFFDNGYYKMENRFLFEPPAYNKKMLHHIYNAMLALLKRLQQGHALQPRDRQDLEHFSSTLMICFLNGFPEAKQKLIDAKPFLKALDIPGVYQSFKDAMRVLRKMKYDHLV